LTYQRSYEYYLPRYYTATAKVLKSIPGKLEKLAEWVAFKAYGSLGYIQQSYGQVGITGALRLLHGACSPSSSLHRVLLSVSRPYLIRVIVSQAYNVSSRHYHGHLSLGNWKESSQRLNGRPANSQKPLYWLLSESQEKELDLQYISTDNKIADGQRMRFTTSKKLWV